MTIEDIQARDPAFDRTSFLARAEAVYATVQRARVEGRSGLARPGVSDDMASRLTSELDRLRSAGQQVVCDARITSSTIVDASAEGTRDTIAVRFSLEGTSYLAAGGKPISGQEGGRRTWQEDWWFQRPASTTTDAATSTDLTHCLGCGAPANPTPEGRCAYCARPLADPRTWVLTRTADVAQQTPQNVYAAFQMATASGAPVVVNVPRPSLARRLITLVVVLAVVGGIGLFTASKIADTTSEISSSFKEATNPGVSLPEGVVLPPGVTVPTPTTAGTGYLTPVANPQIKAPVNDLPKAIADLKAKVGRPVMLDEIHLYQDGRIILSIQAADDPLGIDRYTWKRGQLGEQEQAPIGAQSVNDFFSIDRVDGAALERICTTALGKTGVPGGFIDHPYLVNITGGPSWYVPVTNESRRTSSKTYRVSLDGKKEDVF